MNLRELVVFFRNGGTYEQFCHEKSLNAEVEVIEIFMRSPVEIDNDLAFFEIEETEGKSNYILNGVNYHNLFDFFYFLDAIEESNNEENKDLTDLEIARRLFNYAINDA